MKITIGQLKQVIKEAVSGAKTRAYNPERSEFKGRSYKKGGARIDSLAKPPAFDLDGDVSLEEVMSWFDGPKAPSNQDITRKIGDRELSQEAEEWFWNTHHAVFLRELTHEDHYRSAQTSHQRSN